MQSAALTRRSFLRGRISKQSLAPRPPWSLAEADFVERCTRCDACIEVCPTGILVRADGGYPEVDFSRGECTFCGGCVSACAPAALVRLPDPAPAWSIRALVADSCLAMNGVECRVCGEACPTGAIRFRPRLGGVAQPALALESCNGCGACFAPCPVRAITVKAGVTEMAVKENT